MSETAPQTPREQSKAAVGRLTRLLAGAAVTATALFGVAVASGGKDVAGTATDDAGTTAVDDSSYSSYDDGYDFDLSPSQGVSSSSQSPAATSGGS